MKRIIQLTMVLALCVTLFGCSSEKAPEKPVAETTAFTITDQAGREVQFEKPVKTIVSGYYISTTTLIALGLEDALVGIEMKGETRPIYKEAAPELLELPAMGNMKQFNVEECVKLDPDVVVLPVALSDYADQLEELNIKCVLVNPETQESFEEMVKLFGKIGGVKKTAQKYLDTRKSLLKKYVKDDSEKRVYFASNTSYLEGASASMYQDELIKQAKGINVLGDMEGSKWAQISMETLLEYDPEVIFFESGGALSVESILNDPQLANISAIKNKQVYAFPSNLETWDTPNPSSVLGTLYVYAILHPDKMTIDDVEKEAIQFYKEFYQIDVKKGTLGLS